MTDPRHDEPVAARRLEGRVAVVTGAGRGIGRAIALRFAQEGAKVAVLSRTASTVEEVVDQIETAGGTALGQPCDVSERDQVYAAIEDAAHTWGTVDIVVNNAQGFGSKAAPTPLTVLTPLEDTDEAVWDYTMSSGLWATLWTMKAAFPFMKASGYGRIINFGSPAGFFGQAGNAPYNATKEAIRALTRTAAREWGEHGITANVICPSVRTDAMRAMDATRTPEETAARLAALPLRRYGEPEDVGNLATFLASPEAAFITGDTIMIDSGLHMTA